MPKTKKLLSDSNIISIQEAIAQLQTTEQTLRLALIDIRPDDFDTTKTLSSSDFETVSKKLQQQQQPQLPAQPKNLESLETPTPQASETATEQPQNAPIIPQIPQQHLNPNTHPPAPNLGLSLVEQLAKQAQEEITAVDAIAVVKNQLIINSLAVRDSELQEHLNQHWQHQKQSYLGAIRDLAGLAKEPVEITPDSTDITQEIDSIMAQLGKQLHV